MPASDLEFSNRRKERPIYNPLGINPRFYHYIKPLFPRRLQIFIRHKRGKRYRSIHSNIWPIDKRAAKKPQGWVSWPEQKEFAFVLTHDVETGRGLSRCMELIKLEQSFGFKSAFNFVAADYPIPGELRDTMARNGFEVGLHGIHHNASMYFSRNAFRDQAKQINRYMKEWSIAGFRSPSMYHNLEWLQGLNLEYDASTFDTDPFEPQPDGVTTIFPFWVPHRDNTSGYVELPYTLPQDFTLFAVLGEKSNDLWKQKLDWIVQNGGMALLITHPDYMSSNPSGPGRDQYSIDLYRQFLEYVKDRYAGRYWHALPREVASFWKTWSQFNSRSSQEIPDLTRLHVGMPTYSFYENDNRVRRYAEALAKAGSSVDVFSLRRKGQSNFEIIEGVRVHRIQQRTKNEKEKWGYFFKLVLFLIKSTAHMSWHQIKKNYNLVHAHNVPDFEVFAAILPKLMGSKIILDIHDIVPELFCSKFRRSLNSIWFRAICLVEKISTAFADHVIVSNGIWGDRIVDRCIGRDKCSVLLNYPDPAIFRQKEIKNSGNREYIIYPGTLNWHQGLDLAIKAFSLIKDQVPQIDFHIYGEGPALEGLIKLTEELGLQDRVFIKGALPIRQIAEVMASAKCGVVPKRADLFGNEAFSTKVLEFMALGVPIVLSKTAIDTYYFNSSLVQFFQPGDEKSLAEKLLLVLTDEDLRQTMVNNSLLFVQDYSWAKRQPAYFALVNSLMNASSNTRMARRSRL
jgi:glycosyltransferase involved in cell wall biosynthesis/peptidoglycan/xylan/chitin deacetylase (PgdA/CDA1 family)